MYLNTFGGSALLHLLMGYPRLILLLGVAGVVAATSTPHGPGRFIGTAQHLSRLDAVIGQRVSGSDARHELARRSAARAREEQSPEQIRAAVEDTLRRCGSGCTDLSTPIIAKDPRLLEDVLTLYYLDRLSERARLAADRPPSGEARQTVRR